jgi:TonB family protein
MRKYNGTLVGILGTVIIHLIAAIIFMSFKLGSLNKEIATNYIVEIAQVDETEEVKEPEESKKKVELPATRIEQVLKGDEDLLNIARNLANKPTEVVNPADYIDKVKEELIKDGKLGTDNYIDEQKRLKENNSEDNLAIEDKVNKPKEEKPKESQEMAANYQGPTRIYYDLAGRNHSYLPIPIYKCQGSGKVVLSIHVNQQGVVEDAQVIPGVSSTSDPCLTETAIATVMISRFNPDINSPKIQTGTLTYEFVAQ